LSSHFCFIYHCAAAAALGVAAAGHAATDELHAGKLCFLAYQQGILGESEHNQK
jgi:hypothetical protein